MDRGNESVYGNMALGSHGVKHTRHPCSACKGLLVRYHKPAGSQNVGMRPQHGKLLFPQDYVPSLMRKKGKESSVFSFLLKPFSWKQDADIFCSQIKGFKPRRMGKKAGGGIPPFKSFTVKFPGFI